MTEAFKAGENPFAPAEIQPGENPFASAKPVTSSEGRFLAGFVDPVIGAAQLADKGVDLIRQRIFPGASSMEDVVRSVTPTTWRLRALIGCVWVATWSIRFRGLRQVGTC